MFRPFSTSFAVAAFCAVSLSVSLFCPLRPAFAAGDDWDTKTALVQSLRQSASRLQKAGNLTGAMDACRQAIHADPLDPDTYADLGDLYFQNHQNADAVRWYREATGTLPGQKWMASRMEDGDLCLRFAVVLAQVGRWDEALTMYQKGRDTLPGDTRKLLPPKWSVKKLTAEPSEQTAFLTTTHLALGAWYADPELAKNDPASGEKAEAAFRAAARVSPGDPTLRLLAQHGLSVKAEQTVLVRRVQ